MGETSIDMGSAPHTRSMHGPEAVAWPSPLLSSTDPEALFKTKRCSAAPSWEQLPIDLPVWSTLGPHTCQVDVRVGLDDYSLCKLTVQRKDSSTSSPGSIMPPVYGNQVSVYFSVCR